MTWDRSLDRITGTDEAHLGLDEIVASNVNFHMERMSDSHLWFVLYDEQNKTAQNVDIHAVGGKLKVHVREVEEL